MDTDEEYGEALPASGSGRGKKTFLEHYRGVYL